MGRRRRALRSLRTGARCAADTDEGEEPALAETAPFIYLRLRREHYDDAALVARLDRLHGGH
jgi:hypothetical protein